MIAVQNGDIIIFRSVKVRKELTVRYPYQIGNEKSILMINITHGTYNRNYGTIVSPVILMGRDIEKIVNVIHNTGKIGVIFQNGFFCVAGTVWGKNPQVIVIFAYVVKRDIQI